MLLALRCIGSVEPFILRPQPPPVRRSRAGAWARYFGTRRRWLFAACRRCLWVPRTKGAFSACHGRGFE